MKKNNLIIIFLAAPVIIFSLFAQEMAIKKPIILHEEKKNVRSASEHLKQFANAGCVILDFYADWCNPCKRMSPLIDALAAIMPEFTFIKINRDFFPDLGNAFGINSIPTLIFLHDGKEIGRYDGGPLTQKKLELLIKKTYEQ